MSHSRSNSHTNPATPRNKASPEKPHTTSEKQGVTKRPSMLPISRTPCQSSFVLHLPKQRRRYDNQEDNIYSSWSSAAPHAQISAPSAEYLREISITTGMQQLSLLSKPPRLAGTEYAVSGDAKCPCTPSYIPKLVAQMPCPSPVFASPSKRTRHSLSPNKPGTILPFLNKHSNTHVAWDTQGRLKDVEGLYGNLKEQMEMATTERINLQEDMNIYRTKSMSISEIRSSVQPLLASLSRGSPTTMKLTHGLVAAVNELESIRSQLSNTNSNLQSTLENTKAELCAANIDVQNARRAHAIEVDDLQRKQRNDLEDMRDHRRREDEKTRKDAQEQVDRLIKLHEDDILILERRLKREIEDERSRRLQQVQELSTQLALHQQTAQLDAGSKDREAQINKAELCRLTADLEREQTLNTTLRGKLSEAAVHTAEVEVTAHAMQVKITFLESDNQAQSQAFADLNRRKDEAIASALDAKAKLRVEETLRRKLHNQVQELKGNIRVFCRVRPTLDAEADEAAKILYPDCDEDSKELTVMGPEQKSALGNVTTSRNCFSFDRVFGPLSPNSTVFEEISQLVQSALDGYNVCIFCYGQTGSGKTYTMSAEDGMIPLAVQQIYETAIGLEEKGWTYTMEGSFVEVHNETINDLLGKAEDLDKKKHEIKHDIQKCNTTITDVTTVMLDSPATVTALLKRASVNRSVAATKSNERSSRSHSVFTLKLVGDNSITGERSEGSLNLVDLAGSERLAHSGATGDRLKETQNINRSLSSLGDVISALGQGKEGAHIPYRNSKVKCALHWMDVRADRLTFVPS